MNNQSRYDAVRPNGVQSGQNNQRAYPPRYDNERKYQYHCQTEQAIRFNGYNKKETRSDAHRFFGNTSSANRGNDGYGQGQEFRQTNGATEFKQMDNREDSSRYYGNQERRGSGYNYQCQENGRRTENRGEYQASSQNAGSRFEQDQQFWPARQTTESVRFKQLDSRVESRRYQKDQGCERSGYHSKLMSIFLFQSRSRQETEYSYRGDYEKRHQPEYPENRFNNQFRHQQQSHDYNRCSPMQQQNGFRSEKFVEQRDNRIKDMRPASQPVSSDSDSDSQFYDGSSTKSLGKAFSFEEMLKSVEEFHKLDWSEEVEKEYAEQQLEKKRAEFFSKAAFIMKPRTGNPVWDIKKRKPIMYREKTYYNYIHYG